MSCYVISHMSCYVMLCCITYVMLRYITYVMLWHLNYISFQCNCENSVLFALGVKYKTALIYQADHKLLSWRNPLYLNHVIFFVAVETCCIYLGSRPYKENYQVSRISHKGCQGHYPALLQSFPVFQHWRFSESYHRMNFMQK